MPVPPLEPRNAEPKIPEHQAIYRQIRDMILFGDVVPGQPVTMLGLKNRLGAGLTPVREAIRRLTAEGALEVLENRRVCVPRITRDKLEEIYFARLVIEPKLAEMAAKNATPALVDKLRAIDERLNNAIATGNIETYLEQNYRFHFCLYDAANASVLRKIAASLWLQVGPSLRIVCGRLGTRNLPDKHKEATGALLENDAVAVARALKEDIGQGREQILESLRESEFEQIV